MRIVRMVRVKQVRAVFVAAALGLACVAAHGQTASASDLTGNWQGTLETDSSSNGKGQRIVLKVSKAGDAAGASGKSVWHGVAYNIDDAYRPYEGRNTTQMSVEGGVVRFAIAPIEVMYEGKLSADGASIVGQWTQEGRAHPLNLARAEGDAAWAVPEEDKAMAKDADPDWDVATVRLGDPNGHGSSLGMDGREFVIKRHTLATMLLFGYGMHKRQLVNAPDWIDMDRWDVRAVPDVPGRPNVMQMQSLMRKLLVERFGLVTHTEQRELSVYALTIAKGGPKMAPSAGDPNGLPNENDNDNGGQRTMRMENATMTHLALLLKFMLDRPVVDQTGLTGRYDFQLKWTMDESRVPTDGSAAPTVFTAIQEQLGLKLEPVKAMTDVMVIDKLERPGAN
jgi:uncharacterized protein (TIGR03435 family)